ncbi:MAG: hypothetical protein FWD53_09655 [Phycisphaerales bacterium]|nr:hypothetical protein [Phycisphaerales bacterium]
MNLIAGAIVWLATAVLVTGAGIVTSMAAPNKGHEAFLFALFLCFCALISLIVSVTLFMSRKSDAPKN